VADFKLEDNVFILFTTRAFATGIPGTLSAATVAVYEDVTATPIQTSIAVTETLNSIAGLNAVTIAAQAASGYNAGGHYHVVIEAGTVDSVSVVGEVVGNFSIQAAPVNWAKVTAPTTAVDLSATDIQLVDTATALTNVINASSIVASISGNVDGDVTGTVSDVADLSNLPTIPTNWITAAGINASALDGKGNWNIGKTGYALTTADWNVGKTGYTLEATTGLGNQTANITGSIASNLELGPTEVKAQADAALTDIHLDHLLAVDAADVVVNASVIAHMVSATEDWSTFVPSTDSQQAVRDRGDAAWVTATGFATNTKQDTMETTLNAAATTTELNKVPKSDGTTTWNATALASINAEADTALTDYDGPTDTEMVAAFTEIKGATWAASDSLESIRNEIVVIDGNVDAIKVPTDKLVFTVANQLDANIQYINDAVVTGDGTTGTEWDSGAV